ncbi:MAG: PIN/TRAM domain-containing protein [Phascolarctobacterium sp.]|nr:PIN/TRAM domain-containing protein [Phascolarctobacterium sp.]
MIKKLFSLAISVTIVLLGILFTDTVLPWIAELMGYSLTRNGLFGIAFPNTLFIIWGAFTFCWLGLILGPILTNWIFNYSERVTVALSKLPTSDILVMVFGIALGLMMANLLGGPFSHLPIIGPYIPIGLSFILSVVGAQLAFSKRADITGFFNKLSGKRSKEMSEGELEIVNSNVADEIKNNSSYCYDKLLDTSVIIDGRIMDIMATGFLEGKLLVTKFVIEELQRLSDSSDPLKRAKGRRGLDLVHDMQISYKEKVYIIENDFEDVPEVDSKLVLLAREINAVIVTNDYNLNKVAGIQGINVLNINELANAIKPVVVSGEEMTVTLMKEGREQGQAVAYLDDGTMIVVENGRRYVGKTTTVIVNSVLQTAAGRMIFAHVK